MNATEVMRHHREMPTKAEKKKKDRLTKAGIRADEGVLSDFAALAALADPPLTRMFQLRRPLLKGL